MPDQSPNPDPSRSIRRSTLREQGEEADLLNSTPAECLAMMWPLALDAWAFLGEPIGEPRLSRHIVRVLRRPVQHRRVDPEEFVMPDPVESLKSQLAALPSRDRAEIVDFLIDSLEPQTEPALEAELSRRVAEIRDGRVSGKPADQVFAELKARFP